jgi:hypothetical protein
MPKNHPAARGSNDVINPLIIDFLHWLAREPRAYAEVMEFWRTSCPRLPIWEDAVDRGFVVRRREGREPAVVELTALGRRFLETGRSGAQSASAA